MTHPSSSETARPLTKATRDSMMAVIDGPPILGHDDVIRMYRDWLKDYEATIRELESRSPSPAPIDTTTYRVVQDTRGQWWLWQAVPSNGGFIWTTVGDTPIEVVAARSSSPSSGIATDADAVTPPATNFVQICTCPANASGPNLYCPMHGQVQPTTITTYGAPLPSSSGDAPADREIVSGDAPATPEDTELSERLDNIRRQYADRVIGYAEMSAQFENLARSHSETPNG